VADFPQKMAFFQCEIGWRWNQGQRLQSSFFMIIKKERVMAQA
jgi:hypothetical protein